MLQGGRDVLAVLPTGFGKSLIYQLVAVSRDAPTVAVFPLLALIRDQFEKLTAHGVDVVRVDSSLRAAQRRDALARIDRGGSLIVLTTPESLENREIQTRLRMAQPSLMAIDEAHAISEWGHDFRPAYLRLGALRRALGIAQVVALTATATERVRKDVVRRASMKRPAVIVMPPARSNLAFAVHFAEGNLKFDVAGKLLRRLSRPGIVYCATTRAVDALYAAMVRARIGVERYHGKMRAAERQHAYERFMSPKKRLIMVATNAFGMGVDKSNIRYVMHFQVPGSPEQYVQEAGRAGRDGHNARCILLYDPEDLRIQEMLNEKGRASPAQRSRVARTLAHYRQSGRQSVELRELALAASVSLRLVRSSCAELEQLGVLANTARHTRFLTDLGELEAAASDLSVSARVQKAQDDVRLAAMAGYAEGSDCRDQFLRRWFGERNPPTCGRCDVCRRRSRESLSVRRAISRAKD